VRSALEWAQVRRWRALAGTMAILIGSIDLSVAGIVAVSGIVCAKLIDDSGNLVAVLMALGVGGAHRRDQRNASPHASNPELPRHARHALGAHGRREHDDERRADLVHRHGLPNFINNDVLGIPVVILLTSTRPVSDDGLPP
jgi:hypothetical protein